MSLFAIFLKVENDVIKLFWRKSKFPTKLKQQEQAILKAINSFRVLLKNGCIVLTFLNFRHSDIKLFKFINLWEI